MNWYLQNSNKSEVVFNSKIAFARNINGYPFELKSKAQVEDLENKIQEKLFEIGYDLKFLKLKNMDKISIQSLVEKGLISYEFANKNIAFKSILLNDDENICVEINGENHLNIQVFGAGLNLIKCLQLAIEIDNKLDKLLGYSISKKYGYLTSGPYKLGTGMDASVEVHLPALSATKNIRKIKQILSGFGIEIESICKNVYKLSNQKTLGVTEDEITTNLNVLTEKIISQEKEARQLLKENTIELEDKILRSYGIISNCKKISYDELLNYLSDIKLGTDLGIIENLTDLKVLKLYIECKPNILQKSIGQDLEKTSRDIARAEKIKKIINE